MILASNMLNQSQLLAKLSENIRIMILQTMHVNTTISNFFELYVVISTCRLPENPFKKHLNVAAIACARM
jgi:translation initiation factor 2 beta subunit (eIF-2beta)/eIF-5